MERDEGRSRGVDVAALKADSILNNLKSAFKISGFGPRADGESSKSTYFLIPGAFYLIAASGSDYP
jgi:hypothetical protein